LREILHESIRTKRERVSGCNWRGLLAAAQSGDGAQKRVADNVKFNPQTLLDTVKRSMQTSKLLDENSSLAIRSVDILITDMRARSNFTAIAFGFMAGADMVKGDVITRDLQGKEIDRFEVHADYALGGLAGGMDSTRMDWLYE
jgi:hypothetical protein